MLSYLDINLSAIKHNFMVIKSNIDPEVKIIAVVKANAYGHGLVEVGRMAWASGSDMLAVADIEEAIQLRLNKVRAPILILGYTEPSDYHRIIEHSLQITLFNQEDIRVLSQVAADAHSPVRVHVKVDTGMRRLGIAPSQTGEFVNAIKKEPYLIFEAMYSHFADVSNESYSKDQIREMQSALFSLQQTGITDLPMVHMAASGAIMKYPEAHFDAVRPGLAIYGIEESIIDLKPALSWRTKIVHTKRVSQGAKIGYGLTFTTKRISAIAVLPVGYADGYCRSLSNRAQVLIDGKRAKVIGRVCMNQTIIDVTGLHIKPGMEVTLIGRSGGDNIRVQDLAKWADTNPHEIVARLNPNVYRKYLEN